MFLSALFVFVVFVWSIAEIVCRDSFGFAVGSLSVKISSQMLLKFAARMMSSWMWLFAGGSSGGVFTIKGEVGGVVSLQDY